MKNVGISHNGPLRNKGLILMVGALVPRMFKYFGTNGVDPTTLSDEEGGSLALATAGADNDGNFAQTNEFVSFNHANEKWSFACYGKFSDDDQIDSYFAIAVTPANDAAITGGLVDGLGYVSPDGSANIALQCIKDSTDVGDADTGYDQDTSAHVLRIEVQTGNTAGVGDVQLYRDNVLLDELKGVQLPEDELLAIIFGSQAGEVAAKTSTLYWMAWDCPYSYHL
jgi:hypothetical protein